MTERLTVNLMPPLLKQNLEKYNAVMPPFAAAWNRVYIYPLKEKDVARIFTGNSTLVSGGGIEVPDQAGQVYAAQIGLIVSMGPTAIKTLYSVGIELGQVVVTNRLSRWEKRYWANGREHTVMIATDAEITGSVDLARALFGGGASYEMTESGDVEFNPGDGAKPAQEAPEQEYGV